MNVRKLYFFVALLICCGGTSLLHAQRSVQGKITDSLNIPVAHAVVLLLKASDSTLLYTSEADSSGIFSVVISKEQPLLLKVTAIGYRDEILKMGYADSAVPERNIVLHESYGNLSEVTITEKKALFERKPDRIIFNVPGSLSAPGSNALEMMKKAPGVVVRRSDNTIGLSGKSSVQVLINDQLLQLSAEDLIAYLEAIPAESVERIEVITAPPARYEAAGNSGLINIVLKKKNLEGISGQMRTAYEQASYAKAILGGDLNYHNGKLGFYGNVNYSNGSNQVTERLNTPYPGQIFKVTDNYKKTLKPLQLSFSADYELNKNNTIGIQWLSNYGDREDDARDGIHVRGLPLQTLDSTMLTKAHSLLSNQNHTLNLNYTGKLDSSGKKLVFNANKLWFGGNRTNNFETINYLDEYTTPSGISSRNKTTGRQDISITTLQADLDLPYKWASVSLGGKLSFISNRSNNRFGYFDQDGYHEDLSISNGFDYTEQVQALYVSAQRKIKKWSLQAGLRGEFTQTSGYSFNLDQTHTNHYFNLFPTAYLQYQWNEDNVWNLNYGKRIDRPGYRSLDPYRAFATPYHYSQGNPFLLPSFNHNIELNYTYKGKYTLTAFYQLEQNHFGAVWKIDTVLHTTSGISMNFADYSAYGLNAMGSFRPLKAWDIQVQVSLQQQQLNSTIYTAVNQSYRSFMYYAGLNNSFTLNASGTLFAELNVFYISRYREDFLEINPIKNVDIGFKALLWKQRVVVGINGSDIFATEKAHGIHIVTGQTINNYFDTRNVRLSLQYKFGNKKGKDKQESHTGIEEESQRVK